MLVCLHRLDPVALDQACADLCNQMPVIDGSELDKNIKEMGHKHHDHFHMTHPDAEWETCLLMQRRLVLAQEHMNFIQFRTKR